jgi:predicted Zn finger-like uncharacterized protein
MTARRRERITLQFHVDIVKGKIDGERIAEACAAAIRVFGVIEGEVLSGARFTRTTLKTTDPKIERIKRQKFAAKLDEQKSPCPDCSATYDDRLRIAELDDGTSDHTRCATCDTIYEVKPPPSEPKGRIVHCTYCNKTHFALFGEEHCDRPGTWLEI